MIQRWSRWVVRHRTWVIAIAGVLTLAALVGMRRLYFSNRLVDWLPKDDPQIARHIAVSERFSVNNMVLVLVKPEKGVFRAAFLQKVKDLTERLKEMPGIAMVTSMGNAADIRKIPGGIEVANLLDRIPATPAA
jgi:predicted RND superfamily exporter protein